MPPQQPLGTINLPLLNLFGLTASKVLLIFSWALSILLVGLIIFTLLSCIYQFLVWHIRDMRRQSQIQKRAIVVVEGK
jgi:hypothetical protein